VNRVHPVFDPTPPGVFEPSQFCFVALFTGALFTTRISEVKTMLLLLLLVSARAYQIVSTAPLLRHACGTLHASRTAAPHMLLEVFPAPLLEFGSFYMDSLNSHPIGTKVVTAATLAMTGDLIAQQLIEKGPYDTKRGVSFGLFDAIYRGGFQHFLFPLINDAFHGELLLRILPDGNVGLLAALERTFANQLVVRLPALGHRSLHTMGIFTPMPLTPLLPSHCPIHTMAWRAPLPCASVPDRSTTASIRSFRWSTIRSSLLSLASCKG
jgi:hypothetical protein